MSSMRLVCSPKAVKANIDNPEQAMDDDIEVRIYGGVWVGLDDRPQDGNWNVQYLHGEPGANGEEFSNMLGITDGMLAVPAETSVEEVRAR